MAWRAVKGGIEIAVRLTPRSSLDRIGGIEERGEDRWLAVSVRAVPEIHDVQGANRPRRIDCRTRMATLSACIFSMICTR